MITINDNELSDGSVIPHGLPTTPYNKASDILHFNNILKLGTVIRSVYPDDGDSITKLEMEYDVLITENNHKYGVNASVYRNCRVNNQFGNNNNSTVNTFFEASTDQGVFQNGSTVAVLCVDGRSDAGNPLIMCGVSNRDPLKALKTYKRSDGQFYDFNFNGVNVNINKDGEYMVQFNSPIDFKGNKTNEAAAGTTLKIDKNGVFSVLDNENESFTLDRVNKVATWTNGNDSIIIDKANKKIELISSGEVDQSSKAKFNISSQDELNTNSQKDTNIASAANATIKSGQALNMNVGSNWVVNVQGNTTFMSGGNLIMQSGNTAQMMGEINLIGTGNIQAAGVGISTAIGVGNLGGPVLSTIITGSSTVFIGT